MRRISRRKPPSPTNTIFIDASQECVDCRVIRIKKKNQNSKFRIWAHNLKAKKSRVCSNNLGLAENEIFKFTKRRTVVRKFTKRRAVVGSQQISCGPIMAVATAQMSVVVDFYVGFHPNLVWDLRPGQVEISSLFIICFHC